MDGIHDLGGKSGFGTVELTGANQVFHTRWEAAVFAMVGAGSVAGAWYHADRFRHAIERIDPEAYLTHGYYGRWLGGVETLLIEAGIVTREELENRLIALGGSTDDLVAAKPSTDPDPLGPKPGVSGARRTVAERPRYRIGEQVRTDNKPVSGHTRLPGYARGKVGVVTACHDAWVYPDTVAHGRGENPQYLYTVRFTSEVLWNKAGFSVSLDLFEPYLFRETNDDRI